MYLLEHYNNSLFKSITYTPEFEFLHQLTLPSVSNLEKYCLYKQCFIISCLY